MYADEITPTYLQPEFSLPYFLSELNFHLLTVKVSQTEGIMVKSFSSKHYKM